MSIKKLNPDEKLAVCMMQQKRTRGEILGEQGFSYYEFYVAPDIVTRKLKVNKLTLAQWCVVFRIREKLKQFELAEQMGVTRLHINRMEKEVNNPKRLVNYWRKNVPTVFEHVVSSWPLDPYGNRSKKRSKASNSNKNIP